MADSATTVLLAAAITALPTSLAAYYGFRGKSKDSDLATRNADREADRLDREERRKELKEERERANHFQDLYDKGEEERLKAIREHAEEIRKHLEEKTADQRRRHDYRSIIRSLLARTEDANDHLEEAGLPLIETADIREKVKELDA